jgi:1,4-alpha-glucan branching enzyme
MYTRPGKKLLFMGTELAPWTEWNHDGSLDWSLEQDPNRAALERYISRLGALYRSTPAFWHDDSSWEGFTWIDVADKQNSVISYLRRAGDDHAVVILHFTPVPCDRYRIGVPSNGGYELMLSSDEHNWGGSGYGRTASEIVRADPIPFHGYPQSVEVSLPPLGALVLVPARV